MDTRLMLQYGLACLQELDRKSPHCLSVQMLSHKEGIPAAACREVLERLTQAGLVEQVPAGFRLAKSIETITSLEVVEAISATRQKLPQFRMLIPTPSMVLRKTLEAVARTPWEHVA